MVKGAVSVGILSNYGLRARFTVDLYDIIKLYEDIDKNAIYDDGERDCIGMFDDNEDDYGYIIYLDDMIMSLYQKLNNNSRYLIDKLYKNNVTSIYIHHEDL